MLFTWATQDDREYAHKNRSKDVHTCRTVTGCKYALRIDGNEDRAESLAAEIIESYPFSTEARYAKELLPEIFGVDGSEAGAYEQQRRRPKLTPKQEANLQRHLRYQKGERTQEQGLAKRGMQGILILILIVLVGGIASIWDALKLFATPLFVLGVLFLSGIRGR
jgi:hypothetical protein